MAVKQSDFKAKPKNPIDLSSSGKALQASKSGSRTANADAGLAAMFGIDTNTRTAAGIQELGLDKLIPYSQPELGFREQPFKVLENAEMEELSEDIKANGIHQALIVRPHGDGYMILAGHRRFRAAQIAGLVSVPCVVRDVDDATAAMIVTQTNLLHRQTILPSEKALAYKLRLEAMKRQAGRPRKNVSQIGTHLEKAADSGNVSQIGTHLKGKRSDAILADEVGESRNQINRYIRLTSLNAGLLEMVDNDSLPMTAGVSLSYLPPPLQKFVYDLLQESGKTVNIELAEQLRNAQPLNEDTIEELILPSAAKKEPRDSAVTKPRIIKIPFAEIAEYFVDTDSDKEIVARIIEALGGE